MKQRKILFVMLFLAGFILSGSINLRGQTAGTCLRFVPAGKSKVVIPNHTDFEFGTTQDFTIETWFKHTSSPFYAGIVIKGINDAYFQIGAAGNKIKAEISAVSDASIVSVQSTSTVNDGVWHHVAFVVDRAAQTAYLYIDGVLENQVTNAKLSSNLTTTEPIRMGEERNGIISYDGSIDELRIWNRKFTSCEILDKYQYKTVNSKVGLLAYYDFDENTGNVLTDKTGNGHNGTLTGTGDLTANYPVWESSGNFIINDLPNAEVATVNIDNITQTKATLHGSFLNGTLTEYGVAYATTDCPAISDNYINGSNLSGADYSVQITGLTSGITYYARAYAKDATTGVVIYGDTKVFNTAGNYALNFNAPHKSIVIPHNTELELESSTDFTAEAWFKHTKTPFFDGIISKGFIDGYYQIGAVGNRLKAEISPVSDKFVFALDGTSVVNDGNWHHVALVINRAEQSAYLYVDGVLEDQVTDSRLSKSLTSTKPLKIGTERLGWFNFTGSIDQVRIWNRAFDVCQINEIKNTDVKIDAPGLVAFYDFNETSGNILHDLTGKHDGVFSTGPVWETSDVPLSGQLAGVYPATVSVGTITQDFAEISCNLTGTATEYGIVYSQTETCPTIADTKMVGSNLSGAIFSVGLPGLTSITTYYVRAYATNADGTNYGATIKFTTALPNGNYALNFSARHKSVIIPHSIDLELGSNTDFTAEAWFKHTKSPFFDGIISKGKIDGYYQIGAVGNRLKAEISPASDGVVFALNGTSIVNDGNWHHVALVINRAEQSAYLIVDGVLEDQVTDVRLSKSFTTTEPLKIGTERLGLFNFTGSIDQVRIWNRTFDVCQINEIKNTDVKTDAPGLLAFYDFNENSGNILPDLTGKHNGEFEKGPVWEPSEVPVSGNLAGVYPATVSVGIIKQNSAEISCNLIGTATEYGVVYSASETCPTKADIKIVGSNLSAANYSVGLIGLNPATTYFVRAYADNIEGTNYGNSVIFTTLAVGEVIIKIIDINGNPVFPATVTINGSDYNTDKNGELIVALSNGDYSIVVTSNDYIPSPITGTVNVTNGITTTVLDQALVPEAKTTVNIQDKNGKPVYPATVSMDGVNYETNTNGDFMVTLPDGVYSIDVTSSNYTPSPVNGTVTITNGIATTVLAQEYVPSNQVIVPVDDINGDPVYPASVNMDGILYDTDLNGEFITFLVDGVYPIVVTTDSYKPSPVNGIVTIASGIATTVLDQNLVPIRQIIVPIKDINGDPVYPIIVLMDGLTYETGKNGEFIVDLPDGVYPITVGSEFYTPSPVTGTVTIAGGIATTVLDESLIPNADVVVKITDINNDPVYPATVTIDEFDFETDANGEFIVTLPDGVYPIVVTTAGYVPSPTTGTVTITGGIAATVLDYNLNPLNDVIVTIKDKNNNPVNPAKVAMDGNEYPTDANGQFTITIPDGAYPIVVNANGYVPSPVNGTVTVTNGIATTVLDTKLSPANVAPTFTSSTSNSVSENQTAILTVTATDSNGDNLTFSISGGDDQAKFSLNTTTGVLIFTAAPDFEIPTDTDKNNSYLVTISVTDGKETVTQTITVSITNVVEFTDNKPVITSADNIPVKENQTEIFTITATDADDGDALIYTITGGGDKTKFQINETTGVISFVTSPDFETPTDADNNNIYEVEVTVTDKGGNATTQLVKVSVTNVNEKPEITVSTPNLTGKENGTDVPGITITVTDPDQGDKITYKITDKEDGKLFQIDENGILTFINSPDFETPLDKDKNNEYIVEVVVTDPSGLSDTLEFVVTIENVSEPTDNSPKITSGTDCNIDENGTGVTTIIVEDGDIGDKITFEITGGEDKDLFTIDPVTGEVSFISSPDFELPADANGDNEYIVEITVTDSAGQTDTITLTISVSDVFEVTPKEEPKEVTEIKGNNVLSPNGDGKNDFWVIENAADLIEYDLFIFNNIGETIYKTKSYDNTWDGTYKNRKLPAGTYYYMFKNGKKTFKGVLTIVQ